MIWPRRVPMSVITAPRCSSSTVTVTVSIGSSRHIVDGEAISRRARPAAVWNATSEESTEWALPSVRVTLTSTTGQPASRPFSSWWCTPFSTDADELPRHGAADDDLVELDAGARAGAAP